MTFEIPVKFETSGKLVSLGSNLPGEYLVEDFTVKLNGLDVTNRLSLEEYTEAYDNHIAEAAAVREAGMSA